MCPMRGRGPGVGVQGSGPGVQLMLDPMGNIKELECNPMGSGF